MSRIENLIFPGLYLLEVLNQDFFSSAFIRVILIIRKQFFLLSKNEIYKIRYVSLSIIINIAYTPFGNG